jgi:hypothetical protein
MPRPDASPRLRVVALAVLMACGLMPWLLAKPSSAEASRAEAVVWPDRWEGRPIRPLALSPVERRFADRFPGAIGRFTDGERVMVLREVVRPTRMLHPATDCYRGLGFRVEQAHLERDSRQRLWRCFTAGSGRQRLRVCERIEDSRGQGFTDTSAWFWSASLGQSEGPWRAVTVVSPWRADPGS